MRSTSEDQMTTFPRLAPRTKLIAILAMIGSGTCWGLATVMSRDLLTDFSPPGLLLVQLIASVLTLLLLALPQRPWRYLSPPLARASWTGLLEPGLTYSIGLWGLSLTSAGNASIISATEPILIVLLVWLLFGKRPSARLALCIVVAGAGLALIGADSSSDGSAKSLAGDALIVLSMVFAASYVVFSSRLAAHFPAAVLASAQQMMGLAYAALLYFAADWGGLLSQSLAQTDPALLGYAALSGVVQYALAFWLYLIGLKSLSAGAAALWLTLTPIFGVGGAYVWLGEIPTVPMLLGMVLILGAVSAGRREQ